LKREKIENLYFKDAICTDEQNIRDLDNQCKAKHISTVFDDTRNMSELDQHADNNIPMDSPMVICDTPMAINENSSNTEL
jgi:hypothetical protein